MKTIAFLFVLVLLFTSASRAQPTIVIGGETFGNVSASFTVDNPQLPSPTVTGCTVTFNYVAAFSVNGVWQSSGSGAQFNPPVSASISVPLLRSDLASQTYTFTDPSTGQSVTVSNAGFFKLLQAISAQYRAGVPAPPPPSSAKQ